MEASFGSGSNSARAVPADVNSNGLIHFPISFIVTLYTVMPHSFHSHSGQFCKHAVGLLEDVVKEASKQGFEIYGLTEHAPRYRARDLYPEEVMLSFCMLYLANLIHLS